MDRIELRTGTKRIIVNEQDGKYNVIVLSDEPSTDDHGEYIKLDTIQMVELYSAMIDIVNEGDTDGN